MRILHKSQTALSLPTEFYVHTYKEQCHCVMHYENWGDVWWYESKVSTAPSSHHSPRSFIPILFQNYVYLLQKSCCVNVPKKNTTDCNNKRGGLACNKCHQTTNSIYTAYPTCLPPYLLIHIASVIFYPSHPHHYDMLASNLFLIIIISLLCVTVAKEYYQHCHLSPHDVVLLNTLLSLLTSSIIVLQCRI